MYIVAGNRGKFVSDIQVGGKQRAAFSAAAQTPGKKRFTALTLSAVNPKPCGFVLLPS